jgi:membrane peptidoglycan carboxypeptidase
MPRTITAEPPRREAALGRLAAALGLVVAVTAAIAVPAGLALSRGATWADQQKATLPAQLLAPATSQATRIYADDGKTLITTFYEENRHDVSLRQIAPIMQQAMVAAEDTRFFEHGGVGAAAQGASTLTMQYVRNVLKEDPTLSAAEKQSVTADTLSRKIREAQYAIELEQKLTKPQILENYLNIVYFGDGAYGIDAAARTFFAVAPNKLDLAQAAMIAGIVQSPDTENR